MQEADTTALRALLDPLPDSARAELLAEVRKLSIHQDDDELFKLLKILSLYAAFYQTIPTAIQEVHDRAITRIEELLGEPLREGAIEDARRIEPLLEQVTAAIVALRNSTPPPFEEFRATMEALQANTGNINRYSRELITELQKTSALARQSWTLADGKMIFTASVSSAIGASAIYVLLRYFPS